MEVSSKVTNILSALKELYPDALCALHFDKDYERCGCRPSAPTPG